MTAMGNFLKAARAKAKVSQKQVTDALGLTSPMYLSNVERGIAALSPAQFKPVSKIIDVSVEALIKVHLKDVETKVRRIVRES